MILALFNEKDKENKIKDNKKNLFNYLNVADLWDKDIYKETNCFNSDLADLKKANIPINKIIWLYDFLVEGAKDEEDLEKEIKDYIEKKYKKPDEENEEKQNGKEGDNEEEEDESNSDDDRNNDEDDEAD